MKEDYARLYTEMHRNDKAFAGRSIRTYVKDIASLVKKHDAKRLLDYGSGKGYQYLQYRVHEQWGGVLPYCYDVGVRQLSERPQGKFDGVICTDVLEHIAEEDVDEILADIFGLVKDDGFILFAISCRPASKKTLPDGRNVHLTVRDPGFWSVKIAAHYRKGLEVSTHYEGHE